MDIYCPKCGEPCDIWEFDDPADRKRYAKIGCEAVGFGRCTPTDPARQATLSAIAEVMGDDLDGMAAMAEDAEMLGLL